MSPAVPEPNEAVGPLAAALKAREEAERTARFAQQRLELIARITGSLVGRQTVVELARQLSAQVRETFAVDACIIRLLEADELVLLGAAGAPESQLAMRMKLFGLGQEILSTRRALVIEDVFTHPLTAKITSKAPGTYPFRSYAGVPLLTAESPLGVLGIYTHQTVRTFTPTDVEHLQILANHIATALANERLYRTVSDQQSILVREIADRQQAELERQRLADQLRQAQKLESIGQLAAGVAHDFNNILTIINSNASLLVEGEDDPREARAMAEEIVAAGERAANLTRQLLLFSRKQRMQPQAVDLIQLTANLTKMLGRMLREDITLEFSHDGGVAPVEADPGMIEQVIMNLAVNARDAMPRGGQLRFSTHSVDVTPEFVLRNPEATAGSHVCLTVGDTGEGIPPEIRTRIFEPFFTTKEIGKGTGLGLATVYGIIKQHHGWIEVDSTVGQGSKFSVFLPVAKSPTTAGEFTESWLHLRGKGERILVVEDENAVRELAVRLLTRQGFEVIAAASGVAARQLPAATLQSVHLLLTDMVMPGGCNGRELAESLHRLHPSLPVIYCSGYTAESAALERELQHGALFLQKPFMPHQLLRAIHTLLNRPPAVQSGARA